MPQAAVTLIGALVLESDIRTHTFDDHYTDVALILLTCLLAMVMNVTSFGTRLVCLEGVGDRR